MSKVCTQIVEKIYQDNPKENSNSNNFPELRRDWTSSMESYCRKAYQEWYCITTARQDYLIAATLNIHDTLSIPQVRALCKKIGSGLNKAGYEYFVSREPNLDNEIHYHFTFYGETDNLEAYAKELQALVKSLLPQKRRVKKHKKRNSFYIKRRKDGSVRIPDDNWVAYCLKMRIDGDRFGHKRLLFRKGLGLKKAWANFDYDKDKIWRDRSHEDTQVKREAQWDRQEYLERHPDIIKWACSLAEQIDYLIPLIELKHFRKQRRYASSTSQYLINRVLKRVMTDNGSKVVPVESLLYVYTKDGKLVSTDSKLVSTDSNSFPTDSLPISEAVIEPFDPISLFGDSRFDPVLISLLAKRDKFRSKSVVSHSGQLLNSFVRGGDLVDDCHSSEQFEGGHGELFDCLGMGGDEVGMVIIGDSKSIRAKAPSGGLGEKSHSDIYLE